MKEMYHSYRNEISKKRRICLTICFIFITGLVCGSLYITILNNNDKTLILNKVSSFITSYKKITFEDKLIIFKKSFINNLIYFVSMWFLGISVIGIPIIFLMIFFKSFTIGFSISSLYTKYKLKSFTAILIYLFPNNMLTLFFSLFLASYGSILSINIFINAFKKKNVNFGAFMGKYFFLLLVAILFSVFTSIFEAFITPYFYNIFCKMIK